MKIADTEDLRTIVRNAVGGSDLGRLFTGADVETSDYNDEGGFIRIIVHFSDLDGLSDDDVESITSAIERAVVEKDDRFPSVRFAES